MSIPERLWSGMDDGILSLWGLFCDDDRELFDVDGKTLNISLGAVVIWKLGPRETGARTFLAGLGINGWRI